MRIAERWVKKANAVKNYKPINYDKFQHITKFKRRGRTMNEIAAQYSEGEVILTSHDEVI